MLEKINSTTGMNILEEIILFKRLEVNRKKNEVKLSDLEQTPYFHQPCLSLKQSLLDPAKTGIIAEFKRKSPSKGMINETADVSVVTGMYARHGASGLSVLTDEKFFGGCAADLVKATEHNIPVLRKDFIVDEYQLIEAKSIGASVILLIAACLAKEEVKYFSEFAKGLGLEVLLEIHDETELEHICDEVDMVGVNNRSLKTFKVDIQASLRLKEHIPASKLAIAESGISDVATIATMKQAGFKGFLIGETFMKHADPGKAFAEFVKGLQSN
jgi:indole-3-glycerol phosphate synthase